MKLEAQRLAASLVRLPPARLLALDLVKRIQAAGQAGTLDAVTLLQMNPEIETALEQAERLTTMNRRIVRQCLQLTPIPLPKVPLGF
jgi:hypothetical protein